MAGNPVSLDTGTKVQGELDYASADGLVVVSRTYRSREFNANNFNPTVFDREFGIGWSGLVPGHIIVSGFEAEQFYYVTENGTATSFSSDSAGVLQARDKTRATLSYVGTPPADRADYFRRQEQSASNAEEMLLSFADGGSVTFRRVGTFDQANSQRLLVPVTKTDASGYKVFYHYPDVGPLPDVITDSFGKQTSMSWTTDAVPAIGQITLPDLTTLSYTYSQPSPQNKRLDVVVRKSAAGTPLWGRTYLHEDSRFPFALTGLLDLAGNRLSRYTYDAGRRVTLTEAAGAVGRVTINYLEDSEDLSRTVRQTTNALGLQQVYQFGRNPTDASNSPATLQSVETLATASVESSTQTFASQGGLLTGQTDANGNPSSQILDTQNMRPTQMTNAVGVTTQLNWHPSLDLVTTEERPGLKIDYTYTPGGLLLARTETDTTTQSVPYATNGQTRTWTYSWTAGGRIATVDGPKATVGGINDLTAYAYDSSGNVSTITNGLNQVTSFGGYDANGRPGTMTDPNGIVTAFTYDGLGRTTSVTVQHPSDATQNATTTFDYDLEGRVTGITAPITEKLIMDYNLAGQLTAIRNASGDRIDYTLNAMGGITSETTKTSGGIVRNTVSRTFDELNRLLTSTLGPNRTTRWGYDKNGNAVRMVSPRNAATTFAFDAIDRLTSTIAPAEGTTTEQYDERDNPVAHTDSVAVTTNFVHNGFGETIKEVSPDRGTSIYYYDTAGDMIASIDGRNQRINFTRDVLGRVTKRAPVRAPGQAIIYTYDTGGIGGSFPIGRLTKVSDPSGITLFKYDHRGNLLVKRQQIGTTAAANLIYTYDIADRIVRMTYPSGRIVNYVRDGKGRVTKVTTKADANSPVVVLASVLTYEPYGVLKSLTYGNGLKLVQDWGTDARLASKSVKRTNGAVVWGASYAYDNDDNIASVTDLTDTTRRVNYAYDDASRLVRAAGTYGAVQQYDYAFDANGNRTRYETRAVVGSASPTTATDYVLSVGTNRLASISGAAARNFAYDGRGNLSTEMRGSVTAVATYDAHGRLTGYARDGEATQSNVYNGLEDRVQVTRTTTAGSDARQYLYDGEGRLLGDYGASATDVRGEFVWLLPEVANDNGPGFVSEGDDGAGGWAPLAVVEGSGTSSVIRWLHGDRQGLPVLTTDTAGAATTPGNYAELSFPGQISTLADLYYNRWRDYDPTTARYVQADPIGLAGGENLYAYAGGNPVGRVDPLGLQPTAAEVIEFGAQWWLKRQIRNAATREIPVAGEALAIGDAIGTTIAVTKFLIVDCPNLEMAENNRQRRARIAGLQTIIDEHVRKLDQDPDGRDSNHWRTEIKAWTDEIQRIRRRLPNGR